MDTIAEADETEFAISGMPDNSKKMDLLDEAATLRSDTGGSDPTEDRNIYENNDAVKIVSHSAMNQIEDLKNEEISQENDERRERKLDNESVETHLTVTIDEYERDLPSRTPREDSVPPIDFESEPETGVFSTGSGRSPEIGGGVSELRTSNPRSHRSPDGKKRLIEMAVEENDYDSMEDDESFFVDGAASNMQVPLILSRLDTGVDLAYHLDETFAGTSPAKSASFGRHTKLRFMDAETNSRLSDDVTVDDVIFDDKDLEFHDNVTIFRDDVTIHDDVTTHADDATFNNDLTVCSDGVTVDTKKSHGGGDVDRPKSEYSKNRARTMMFSVVALKDLEKRARQHRTEEEMTAERENRDKYLRNADNLRRAHEAMRESFMDLLVEKVDKDREKIRQRSAKWDEKRKLAEENLQKERRSKVPKKTKVEVSHDQDFLDRVPKSRIYQVLRLREEWKKQGKLKNQSDDVIFWERVKSGKNPVDEEIKNRIEARKMAASAVSQSQSSSATKTVSGESQGEEPTGGLNLLLRLMNGKANKEVPVVQEPPKTAPAKPKEQEIANQLPNLLNVPQFTKRRRSIPKPEPGPILQLFKRPEMPKLKSLENHFEDSWSKEQQELMEKRERLQRAEERKRQMKRTQIMYQNAITHMAITNRLMARGFEEITEGSNIRDLVQQDEFNPSEIPVPKNPQPKGEPITYPLFTQSKLIPIDVIKTEKTYIDKQYDKPSSTKKVDRRRVKQPMAADLQPFQQQQQQSSAALSLNSILPTSVVRQPNWHRAMWSNYNLIGVTNPDQQSQKWEQNKSVFGEELASSTLLT